MGFIHELGRLFWLFLMLLLLLAGGVAVLRVARNRVPASSGVVNKASQLTGLSI